MTRSKWLQFILDQMIWFILILVVIFFTVRTGGKFLSGVTLINVLLHASVLGVLTIGQTICLLSGNFDLSAEGIVSFLTVLAAWLMLPYREMTLAQAGGIGWEAFTFHCDSADADPRNVDWLDQWGVDYPVAHE